MIDIQLQATQDWLSCWFIEINSQDPKQLQEELTKFLDSINVNQFTILILKQTDWYLYNYIQMMLLKTGKSIGVNYLIHSPQHHLQILSKLVKQVDSMDLKIGFDLSKEQLAFLMLNIPGFINYLTRGGSVEDEDADVDMAFQEFVQKYPSIKLVVSSNEFTIK